MCVQNKSPVNELVIGTNIIINENVLKRKSKKYIALFGKAAIIRSIYDSNIGVKVAYTTNKQSSYGYFYLTPDEFDLVTENKEVNMNTYNKNNYKGEFRIVTIQFLDNDNFEISYRLYEDGFEYKEGDLIVVKSAHHGWSIAKIKAIYDVDSNVLNLTADENREVICPIDASKFFERDKKAKELVKLKQEMDKKVKELQGVALYRLMAQNSPELKSMLDKYEQLLGHEMSVNEVINET